MDTSERELSPEEKRVLLYREQVKLLRQFLQTGAITQAQFDKSYGDLTVKMGMEGKDNER